MKQVSEPNNSTDSANKLTGKVKRQFIQFAKIDESVDAEGLEKREVSGIVTAEVPDKENEVCDYDKTKPYYAEVVKEFSDATQGISIFPLRRMHQMDAIGRGIDIKFNDPAKQIYMTFKVVDDDAWNKVKERVYTGFSHGGVVMGKMIPDPKFPGCMRYVAKPAEVSLVDNPCLASAHFELVKADGSVELCKFSKVIEEPLPKRDSNSDAVAINVPATEAAALEALISKGGEGSGRYPAGSTSESRTEDARTSESERFAPEAASRAESGTSEADHAASARYHDWRAKDLKEEGNDAASQAHEAAAAAHRGAQADASGRVQAEENPGHSTPQQGSAAHTSSERAHELERESQTKKSATASKPVKDSSHISKFLDALGKAPTMKKELSKEQIAKREAAMDAAITHALECAITKRGLKKSMYSVADMAAIISALRNLLCSLDWEQEYEGDESPATDALRIHLASFADVLVAYVTEEVQELKEQLGSKGSADHINKFVETIQKKA